LLKKYFLLARSLTIILHVVVYGCETWSPTLAKEHRLGAFQNRVLRKIFQPKWDELMWEWRKLHNEELNDLYCSPNIFRLIISRRMRWARHVACMVEIIGAHRVLVGKPDGKRPLGIPRRRWADNTKMDVQDVGCGSMDSIDLAQTRTGGGLLWMR
jgi:hypothetical protein